MNQRTQSALAPYNPAGSASESSAALQPLEIHLPWRLRNPLTACFRAYLRAPKQRTIPLQSDPPALLRSLPIQYGIRVPSPGRLHGLDTPASHHRGSGPDLRSCIGALQTGSKMDRLGTFAVSVLACSDIRAPRQRLRYRARPRLRAARVRSWGRVRRAPCWLW